MVRHVWNVAYCLDIFFFFSSRRRHTRLQGDWSSDVCSSDLHGISARPDLNLMMTSYFIMTVSVLTGPPVLRGSVRIWDYRARKITKTISLSTPDGPALGTMDVKMLPKDPHGYGYVSGMFDGHIYLIDPI